ncbi:MAG TPA: TonB-dependent receptor [Gemmatimonadales bacterium]
MRFTFFKSALRALALSIMLAGGAVSAAAASDPPSISGRVTDAGGQPVDQVTVRVIELRREARTGSDGRFTIAQIPRGTYTVSFAVIGYAPRVRKVTVGDADATLDVMLKASALELPAVQVSASAEATSPMNSPQPIVLASAENLTKLRPTNLGEALEDIAGVRNNSSGEAAGKPVIRGLTNNRVLVLDNGQRLEHNQWGDDHFSSVEPAASSRIEVIRGPASVLYGSDAIGGVINIISPDLPDAIGRAPFVQGSVTGGFATGNNQPDGSLTFEGASGGFGYRVSGTGRTAGDVHTPTYTLWNSGYHNVGGTGTLGYRGPWGSLTGLYTYRNDLLNLTDSDSTATGRAGTDDHRVHVDLSTRLGSSRLDWGAGWERNQRHEWADAVTTSEAFGMRQKSYTTEARLHHSPIGRFSGLVGLSGEYTSDANFGAEFLEPDSKAGDAALYVFEQADVGRWNFSFGGRYDYRHLSVDANTDLGNPAANLHWSSVTGNVGMLYHVSEPVALVLNVGRGFRSPSTFDLFANGPHEATQTFERGNPNLKTETSLNTDAAIRVQSASAAIELGTFVNLIQSFIYTVPTGQVDSASGLDIYDVVQGDAVLRGFEGQIQYHPTAYLHLEGTADYVYGKNTTSGDPLPSMPPFRATYTARLEGRSLGALSSPYFSVGGETNARQTRLNPAEVTFYAGALGGQGYQSASYTLINLATGFSLPAGGRTIQFDLQLRNALNKDWVDYLSHLKTLVPNPGMGRNLIARVTAGF